MHRLIGKSNATQMAAEGSDVIAGVRTEQDGKAITATNPRRIRPVLLDVTSAEHISALANSLPAQLNATVNNAGIAVSGPVEAVRMQNPPGWVARHDPAVPLPVKGGVPVVLTRVPAAAN
jgi:NAD(P)-dependent dehydrogenase (short-subunit alcohol dehydrogenase family)